VSRAVKALAAAALTCVSITAFAQADRVYRIAFIATTSPVERLFWPEARNPAVGGLLRGLADHGYVEGKNLVFERRSAEGVPARVRGIVADLLSRKTEVIVVPTLTFAKLVHAASSEVPIVVYGADPVAQGMAKSLARPGGKITGLSSDVGAGTQEKRLELFLALVPKARRVAFLGDKGDWENAFGLAWRRSAATLGIDLFHLEVGPLTLRQRFADLRYEKPDAFVVSANPMFFAFRGDLGEFSRTSGIPGACAFGDQTEAGCLMSYGPNVNEAFRRMASHVDRILKGASPGDLPFEQPATFEFVINSKTARTVGLNVPSSVLLRADRVIE
jgi:putative ABC transport system substrate-binding protein